MTSELLLGISIFALLLGPAAFRLAERYHGLQAAIDGFSIVTVGSLALLDLAPHSLEEGGPWAALPLAVGFFLPTFLHKLEGMGRFSDHVLVAALLLHSALEAGALGTAEPAQARALGLAIMAHQLPVGLAAYSVASTRRGGLLIIVSLGIAMILGFWGGSVASNSLAPVEHAWLEALAAGSLLHVLSGHEYEPPPNHPIRNVERHLARYRDIAGPLVVPEGVTFTLGPARALLPLPGHPGQSAPLPNLPLRGSDAVLARVEAGSNPEPPKTPQAPQAREHAGHAHAGHAHSGHAHGGHAHGGHAHGFALAEGNAAAAASTLPEAPPSLRSALLSTSSAARAAGLGALSGLVLLALQSSDDHHGVANQHERLAFLERLWDLSVASAPAILLGYLFAGLVALVISERTTAFLRQGSTLSQILRAIGFGLPLPICSCGVLPVYESLARRGVPLGAGMAFLIATPELGIDAALLSWPLLGGQLALVRLAGAFLVAVGAALLISYFAGDSVRFPEQAPTATKRLRLEDALRYGFVEMFDHTMPWILFGLVLAAVSGPLWQHPWLLAVPPWAQVPLLAVVGMPLYVCASGATPLAAVAIQGGLSPGAALAFLFTGPATNATTFGILARLHGKRVAVLFGVSVAGLSVLLGYLVNVLTPSTNPKTVVEAHASGGTLGVLCLGILGGLTLLSLLRQGPRGMLHQVTHAVH